jgi:hypothetical protein
MAYSPMNYYPGYTGNQSYDPYAFETEEERRRKEAEAVMPVKQTIEYDPETGAQKIKIEGSAYNLSQANPNTPTLAGPINPEGVQVAGPADAAFERMRQVESGNRDYDAQGRPITSPKGAMFAAQVMPQTAANPGYGVTPAANQTPEEYNRVGREYYDAMLKKYGGDERLAQAAYNAGPGRVDNAVQVASAQGGDALQYLPRETQQYPGKVANVSPEQLAQQQAAGVPQTRPAINQETGEAYQQMVPAQQPVPGVQMAAAGQPAQATQQPPTFDQQFNAAQNDLNGMRKLLRSAPPQYEAAITDRIIELAQREKAQSAVQQRVSEAIASGDMRGITKEMNRNTSEGSLMKAFLLKTFGMEEAAQKESARALGTDVKYQNVFDPETGRNSLVGVDRFTGMPVKGFDETGVSLTPEQLARVGGSVNKGNYDIVGGTFVSDTDKDAQGRPLVGSLYRSKTNPNEQFIQTSEGRKSLSGFRPQSSQGSLGDMRSRLIQEMNIKLQGKAGEEAMAIQREYNQKLVAGGYGSLQPSDTPITAPQIGGGAATPVNPAAVNPANAGANATAVAAGQAAAGGVPQPQFPQVGAGANAPRATGSRPTGPELDAQAAAGKKFATDTAEDRATIANNQSKSEANADYLVTKINELVKHPGFETSVGRKGLSYGFGLSKDPLLEGTDASDWQARFKEVGGQSFLQAIENLRGLGALSNQEGESATRAIQRMGTSQSEKEFKSAANDFQDIIQRGIDRNRAKLGQEPKYGTPAASEKAAEKQPVAKLSREDTKALEWARQNPNDSRAADIKRRLGL